MRVATAGSGRSPTWRSEPAPGSGSEGYARPASLSRSSALLMHSAAEPPSALIPSDSGPPPAANVHAGRPSRSRSARPGSSPRHPAHRAIPE
ncbi:hypothetical protein E4K10_40225 [Streptomyces sp. T1317-0309]|nr:hypothetical protein E4K10_40225 [Streptomyces sp. T1317-0309]